MKFKICRTSDMYKDLREKPYDRAIQSDNGSYFIEINTPEEFLDIIKNTQYDLVIGFCENTPYVEIYDDYRE